MKRSLLNIFIFSSVLTIFSMIMDGDVKEPSMLMRFVEFFAMLGILFLICSAIYFLISFTYRKIAN